MSDQELSFKLEDTPRELFTKTGDGLPDDYHAFIEAAGGELSDIESALAAIPDWRPAKCLTKLKKQVDAAHPGRDKSKDGTIGDANHCPNPNHTGNSDHCLNIIDGDIAIVTAIDITHDASKCDVDDIVEAIRADKDSRVKYIIWNRRICNHKAIGDAKPWDWRPYNGSNPHTGHCHISVKATKSEYDSEADWKIS